MPPKTDRFEMRMDPEMLTRVDEWREKHVGSLSRAEAIRHLTHFGLVRPAARTTAVEETRGEIFVRVRSDGRVVAEYSAKEAMKAAEEADERGDSDLAILLRERAKQAKRGQLTEI